MDSIALLKELLPLAPDPTQDPGLIIAHLAAVLADLGEVEVVTGEGHRPVVLVTSGSGGLCFSGHLDVVPRGDGWTREVAAEEDGIVYGRGSGDMLGGVAAQVAAMATLRDGDVPFSGVFTTDEETGMAGAAGVKDHPAVSKAGAIVIGEPTLGIPTTAQKGLLWLSVTVHGAAGHGSMLDSGLDANTAAAKLISTLMDWTDRHNYLKRPTSHIGKLSGGIGYNVLAPESRFTIDLRFPPPETPDSIEAELRERFAATGIDHTIERKNELLACQTPDDSRLLPIIREVSGQQPTMAAFATEMTVYSAVTPDIVIWGPGDWHHAHGIDEGISSADVLEISRHFAEVGRRFAASS